MNALKLSFYITIKLSSNAIMPLGVMAFFMPFSSQDRYTRILFCIFYYQPCYDRIRTLLFAWELFRTQAKINLAKRSEIS